MITSITYEVGRTRTDDFRRQADERRRARREQDRSRATAWRGQLPQRAVGTFRLRRA